MPRIPKCRAEVNKEVPKSSKKKFLLSTMFKDEEGFLAEFVAFYKIHGFDHIILWDHNSTDNFREEILPWISTGFVEIRSTSVLSSHPNVVKAKGLDKYWKVMSLKKQIEREAFLWGIKNNFDFYLTADVDEFVLPMYDQIVGQNMPEHTRKFDPGFIATENVPLPFISIADAIDSIFNDPALETSSPKPKPKLYIPLLKYNFNAQPHVLEPVDLLMIESYLTRYSMAKHMNFYGTVMPKYIYRLSGADLQSGPSSTVEFTHGLEYNGYNTVNFTDYQVWLSNCCFFHGCQFTARKKEDVCNVALPKDIQVEVNLYTRHARENSPYWLRMNHYSRSFEKFGVKALTWETANQASNNYDLKEFLSRAYGSRYDPAALVFSCQVRAEINRANSAYWHGSSSSSGSGQHYGFARKGKYWSRNAEFHLNSQSRSGSTASNKGIIFNGNNTQVPLNEILIAHLLDVDGDTVARPDSGDNNRPDGTHVGFIDYYN